MASLVKAKENLEARGYAVQLFPDKESAAEYLNGAIDGTTVGFGGSVTLDQMGLFPALGRHNTVFWHWKQNPADARASAANAAVYLSSVNALAETGEIINIDGAGNRVASTLYGHQKVYLVISRNKLAEDYESALWRARNIAAPLNARRLHRKTPCAQGETLRCYDCRSPERICNGLSVLWRPLGGVGETLVCLVGEDLGY